MGGSTIHTHTSCMAAALACVCFATGPAQGADEAYPVRTITLIVSYAAGGNADLRMRQFAPVLGALLGKPVIVDNKPGAGGNIGTDYIAKAAPDGYTIGVGSFAPLAVNKSLFGKLPFDPQRDLVPVVLIEKGPMVLMTRTDSPFKSVADVIVAAKAKPGVLSIANAGPGGAHHLSAELFKDALGLDIIDVPFKGGAPASTALLGGQVDLMFEQTYGALPSIQSNKARGLAVTAAQRISTIPNIPTFGELGYKGIEVSNWMGIVTPRGTPPAIVARLNAAFNKALVTPEVRDKITGQSNIPGGGTAEDFTQLINAESVRWGALITRTKIKVE